jgi:hypothetical protein
MHAAFFMIVFTVDTAKPSPYAIADKLCSFKI